MLRIIIHIIIYHHRLIIMGRIKSWIKDRKRSLELRRGANGKVVDAYTAGKFVKLSESCMDDVMESYSSYASMELQLEKDVGLLSYTTAIIGEDGLEILDGTDSWLDNFLTREVFGSNGSDSSVIVIEGSVSLQEMQERRFLNWIQGSDESIKKIWRGDKKVSQQFTDRS